MQKRQKRNKWFPVILLFAVCVTVTVLFLAVLQPQWQKEPPSDDDNLTDKEGDEEQLYGVRLLYEQIERSRMYQIEIHNGEHTYSFRRSKTGSTSAAFQLHINGKRHEEVALDDEKMSSLVVAVGTTYVQERLIDNDKLVAADAAEREKIYAKYGLDAASNPAYFEVTTFTNKVQIDGTITPEYKTYRVYVGDETVSGQNYYLRYEGSNAVYVSSSGTVGSVVNAAPVYYANTILMKEDFSQSAYQMKDVAFYHLESANTLIHKQHTVTVVMAELTEGEEPVYETAIIDMRVNRYFQDVLVGKGVGACDLTVQNNQRTWHVREITKIERLSLQYTYLDEDDRDNFNSGVVHKITAPASLTSYTANSSACMTVSECMQGLTATEIVDIDITAEKMEKYGLYAHKMTFGMPKGTQVTDQNGNTQYVIAGYTNCELYVSDVQEDGTRYVASPLYNVIGKVDGTTLSFLEEDFSYWVNDYLLAVYITDVARLSFDFGYADLRRSYTFDLSTRRNNEGTEVLREAYYVEGKKQVDAAALAEVYVTLVNMRYIAPYDESKTGLTAQEIMADEEKHLLSFTVTLDDGRFRTYDFYGYSERHALVAVDGGAHFYVQTPTIKKIASDIGLVVEGKIPDAGKLY